MIDRSVSPFTSTNSSQNLIKKKWSFIVTFWNDFLPTMRFWYFFMHLYRRNQCLESETQIRKMVVKQWGWCDQNLYIKQMAGVEQKKCPFWFFFEVVQATSWNRSAWTGKKGPPHFSSMSSTGVLAFSGIPNEATPPPPAAAAAFGAGRCPPPTKSTVTHFGGFKVGPVPKSQAKWKCTDSGLLSYTPEN